MFQCLFVPSFHQWSLHLTMEGWPGWVNSGGWLHTETIYQSGQSVTHPRTNEAWCRITLSKNVLQLSQASAKKTCKITKTQGWWSTWETDCRTWVQTCRCELVRGRRHVWYVLCCIHRRQWVDSDHESRPSHTLTIRPVTAGLRQPGRHSKHPRKSR